MRHEFTIADSVPEETRRVAYARSVTEWAHPDRMPNYFPGRVANSMRSIIDCILSLGVGLPGMRCKPRFVQLCISSTGYVLARAEGEMGFHHGLGMVEDFERRLRRYCLHAGLDHKACEEVWRRYQAVTTDWREQ